MYVWPANMFHLHKTKPTQVSTAMTENSVDTLESYPAGDICDPGSHVHCDDSTGDDGGGSESVNEASRKIQMLPYTENKAEC